MVTTDKTVDSTVLFCLTQKARLDKGGKGAKR